MPDATHTTLREQVKAAILPGLNGGRGPSGTPEQGAEALTNAVMGVVAERERAIRAEYAPDVSPGDVIHAEPDGTIVLDDGITTWNPSRAVAFLLAERERLLRERIEALPTYRHQADGPCVERDAALAALEALGEQGTDA